MGWGMNYCCCGASIRKLDSTGAIVWNFDPIGHGNVLWGCRFAEANFVYATGTISTTGKFFKINDPSPSNVWTNSATVTGLTNTYLGANNPTDTNIYAGYYESGLSTSSLFSILKSTGAFGPWAGQATTGCQGGVESNNGNAWSLGSLTAFMKVNTATGGNVWGASKNATFIIPNGNNVWAVNMVPAPATITEYDNTGAIISGPTNLANATSMGNGRGICLDSAGNLSILASWGGTRAVKNWTTAGVLNWTFGVTTSALTVAADTTGHTLVTDGNFVRKIDNTGTQVWAFNHTQPVKWVDCDSSDNVLLCGTSTA